MGASDDLIFKVASTPWELEQIRALSYETFVEEIPQHPVRDDRLHTDRFEGENTYFIGLHQDRLIAMMALRDRRPFSLDQKLDDLDQYLPPHRCPCELRLLSVRPEYRKSRTTVQLLALAWKHCQAKGLRPGLDFRHHPADQALRAYGFPSLRAPRGNPRCLLSAHVPHTVPFRESLRPSLERVSPELFRDP